ncbi:MFS transporter [Ruegeria sediminis]|uniref:MFS transporter n=1 Tax=Ruegeria sediminis TaxID=2583820 RepID=A0ABY2WZC2_9RHOB|nr:MFS transporter [Ruegeria sediminis]TMV07941.1 MFS transporter [Ruegeria sediminis]
MDQAGTTRWWILGAMGVILGVILLDETVVGVALPTIQRDIGLTALGAHWVVNIYLLVLAALAGAAGRLGDILGTRVLVVCGLVIFGLASAVAGFAGDGTTLTLARAVQGVGAAVIFPLSLVLVSLSFEDSERGMALGIYGAIGTTFLALGPLVGGLLTEYLSWRWIFWINPPIVLAVAVVNWRYWRDPPNMPEETFDWPGLFLLVGGLTLTVFAVMEGPDRGWAQPDVWGPLILGLAMLAMLIPAELRSATPLIAVRLFTNTTFAAANLIVLLAQYVKIATFVFGAMYFQTAMGLSPLMAGVALLPAVAPPMLMATFAGKAADRYGTRAPSLMGVLGTMLGVAAMALGMSTGFTLLVFGGLLLWGVAVSYLFVPPQRAVMMSVPSEMQGQAGGLVLSSQLLGGTVGMAICSTVYATTGSFAAVFWITAALSLLVLLYGLRALERPRPAPAKP